MSLIKELYDNEYPFNGFNKIRETARAILLNENNEIGMMLIQGEDYFGVRDHYESPGGGVELNEIRLDTVKREVLEEAGYVCDVEKFLGTTINRYNLIQTILPLFVSFSLIFNYFATSLVGYESYMEENFGATPMVLIIKNNKIIGASTGYSEYEDFVKVLNDADIK